MGRDLTESQSNHLLQFMPEVSNCLSVLTRLDRLWTMATLTGKINCSRIAQNLIDFIIKTQDNFSGLKQNLVEILVKENTQKVVLEISAVAQVIIDILKRNLFERTADVGFLATDKDLVQFLLNSDRSLQDEEIIEGRLNEYRDKYTVYNEIIVLDLDGNVCAHLDRSNNISRSSDPLIQETLEAPEYVETYRKSDLAPDRENVLIYSQTIKNPENRRALGILCLVFDFSNEMSGIFGNLAEFSSDTILLVLDEKGTAIASSNQEIIPKGKKCFYSLTENFTLTTINDTEYMVKTVKTKGYQGFFGLKWYGCVMKKMSTAFKNVHESKYDADLIRQNAFFSERLTHVEESSENVLSDLELVVQNGEIMAAKKSIESNTVQQMEGRALPHILKEIKKIGDQVQRVFQNSTNILLELVASSRMHETQFLARLAIDIMDRNLYERANDCRWWALTSDFKRILEQDSISEKDHELMRAILFSINDLYTVYTNLFIYNHEGTIVACSNCQDHHREGAPLKESYISDTLKLNDPARYCVSDFYCTDLYAAEGVSRYTYVYSASITSLEDPSKILGGIGIVFDSEPQFEAMLNDVLPRDSHGNIVNSEGFFVEPDGKVISSTSTRYKAGDKMKIDKEFLELGNGESCVKLIETDEGLYAVGCAKSAGYREYKTDGVYDNDVLSIVRVQI